MSKKYYNNGTINRKFEPGTEPAEFVPGYLSIKREKFEDILKRIPQQEFTQIFLIGGGKAVAEKYNISKNVTTKLIRMFNILITTIADRIDKEEFIKYYNTHTILECANYFDCSPAVIYRISKKFNLTKLTALQPTFDELYQQYVVNDLTRQECVKYFNSTPKIISYWLQKYKITKSLNHIEEHFENNVDINLLYNFYIVDNNSWRETVKKFNISSRLFWYLNDKYNWKKQKWVQQNSQPNKNFANLLLKNNIEFEQEFKLESKIFDFRAGDYLIEVDPSYTHNIDKGIFNTKCRITKGYHSDKSDLAKKHGFLCIHVFDWDDLNKILLLLMNRQKIMARKCTIKLVSKEEEKVFLAENHLLNYIRSDIAIGLYFNENLVSIMTFGKPRYNKNYQFELLRFCSVADVIGGAEKLFKYFLKNYNPKSIISYCDVSKFDGHTYKKLNFELLRLNKPSCHWFKCTTGLHITNNMLLLHGFDRLFNTNYGKGTSNQQLMLENGFVRVYDCGLATYVYIKKK